MTSTVTLKSQGLTMSSYVMINGQIHPSGEASIPALDRGFLYGDCIYEVFSAKQGILIDFDRHMNRLRQSAAFHEIPVPWSDELIRFDIDHLISLHDTQFASLRLVVTRGVGDSLIPATSLRSERYIYFAETAFPSLAPDAPGLKLQARRHPSHQRSDVAKTNNYLNTISATRQAREEGFDDVLWISPDGELIETGSANAFFLCREGDLVEIATPPLSSGILPGITRARIIELLALASIPVTVRPIAQEEIPRFDEAFVCSSVRLLRPVSSIDKHRLHTCRKNAVFWHIHRLYSSWLGNLVDEGRAEGAQH